MIPELTLATIATFRCLIQESARHVVLRLQIEENEEGEMVASIRSQFRIIVSNHAGGKDGPELTATGRSASEAMANLEILLQQWY